MLGCHVLRMAQFTATRVMCFARAQLAETKMDDPNAPEEARRTTILEFQYALRYKILNYCFTAPNQTFFKVVDKTCSMVTGSMTPLSLTLQQQALCDTYV